MSVPSVTLLKDKHHNGVVLTLEEFNRKDIYMLTLGIKNEYCNEFAWFYSIDYIKDLDSVMSEIDKSFARMSMYFSLFS